MAFANSAGGFLVFGVADDANKPVDDRLVGMDATFDFPRHFGDYARNLQPSVYWHGSQPAIPLRPRKVIPVVEIPQSWRGPHAWQDERHRWLFYKRTNAGNERMSYEEIRGAFLGQYERWRKLRLLQQELVSFRDDAALKLQGAPNDYWYDPEQSPFLPALSERVGAGRVWYRGIELSLA